MNRQNQSENSWAAPYRLLIAASSDNSRRYGTTAISVLVALAAVFVIDTHPVLAQLSGYKSAATHYKKAYQLSGRPSVNPQRYTYDRLFYQRDTVSPYINLTRPSGRYTSNYHTFVRPELDRRARATAEPPRGPNITSYKSPSSTGVKSGIPQQPKRMASATASPIYKSSMPPVTIPQKRAFNTGAPLTTGISSTTGASPPSRYQTGFPSAPTRTSSTPFSGSRNLSGTSTTGLNPNHSFSGRRGF